MIKNCEDCEEPQIINEAPMAMLELSKERVIFISDSFTVDMANNFAALLLAYENMDDTKEVTILINSRGGDSSAFILMYDILSMVKLPIKTIAMGKAYSAASLLLSSGTPGKRYAFENSSIMIHGIQCLFPLIGESDLKNSSKYFDFLNHYNNNILSILAKNTGKSLKQVSKDCKKDYFMTAEDALKYGIIDGVVNSFNQIIHYKKSVIMGEIKEENRIRKEITKELKEKLDLSCDLNCAHCDRREGCEDIVRINECLVQINSKPENQ